MNLRRHIPFATVPRWAVLGAALLGLLVPAFNAASAQAVEPPQWKLTVTPNADFFLPGHYGVYKVEAENVGGKPTKNSEPITLENTLPTGLIAKEVAFFNSQVGAGGEYANLSLPPYEVCPTDLLCKWPEGPFAASLPALKPDQRFIMFVIAAVPAAGAGSSGLLLDTASISGGGADTVAASATNEVASNPSFGNLAFASALTDSAGAPYTQAGGHPYQYTTDFHFGTYSASSPGTVGGQTVWDRSGSVPLYDPKEIIGELPPGLIVNPQAAPTCSLADFYGQACPHKTVVGTVGLALFSEDASAVTLIEPVYNLQPTGAYPGELGSTVAAAPFILITAALRSGSDYGVTATSVAQQAGLNRVRLTLWGVPADPSHDFLRDGCFVSYKEFVTLDNVARWCEENSGRNAHAEVEPTPFITMPTECSGVPLPVTGRYNSWQLPGEFAQRATIFPAVEGCNQLHFEPSIEARPTTNRADSPSGFDFKLKVPQGCWEPEASPSFETLCQADLKEAVVKLPPGLVVNPSSGAGLEGCSPAQIGLTTPVGTVPAHFTESPANCPAASKLGTVEVNTPLLHNPLLGAVYLATPHQNPSGALLAGYIVLEGEGVIVKLAGQFQTDPQTGQIAAGFLENPQTPFEEFKFEFFKGDRGSLRTPAVCGTYEVTSTLTPYSAPESGLPAEPTSEFETTAGPGGEGSPCPNSPSEEPHKPLLRAGAETPQAGIYSPYALKLVREDGSQEVTGLETTPPPGLLGRLAGVPYCPDAAIEAARARTGPNGGHEEQANPSCPAASEVGKVDVASGAGPTPLNVAGKAYLAGPYKGAPLSLAIITPAVAGPFDLGTVVVRVALHIDPETTRIHAVSDEIPHIIQGIPLDVRSATVNLNRPRFSLNPTNCEPLATTGSATSLLGATAPLSSRFQVGGCNALKFKPKLAIKLSGATKRGQYPALRATLTYPKKGAYANIARAQVTLPHSAFLAQGHIKTVCTRPQLASHSCPAASVYGHVKATSPLLDKPLEGPVYLGVGYGHTLPDLVADLNGQIEVIPHAKIDTGRENGLRSTFEVVPDAPVSKFILTMAGGRKGLIVNSENLCGRKAKNNALAHFSGQNGKSFEAEPLVANSCKKKAKGHKGARGKHHGHRGR